MLNFLNNLYKRIRVSVERGWCHEDSTHVETNWDDTGGSSLAIFRLYFNVYSRKRMIVLLKHNYPFYHHPFRHPYFINNLAPWEKGSNIHGLPKPEVKLEQVLKEIEEEKINRLESERLERFGKKHKL